jgi:nicotinic acetylcholine receptor
MTFNWILCVFSADGKYEITLMTRANIDYTGRVVWEPPAIYKSSCIIDVEFFPFDTQHCIMRVNIAFITNCKLYAIKLMLALCFKFGSWTYDGLQVDLVHTSQTRDAETNEIESNFIPYGMDLEDFYQSHEWDIMAVPATRNIIGNMHSGEFYPDLTFNITLKRKTLFYMCNLIIPCVAISFLSALTFYLPSESGEKISLCISILLSLTVFILLLNDLLPPTSLVVPLIAKYLLFTVIIVTLTNLVSVSVLNVHFRSPSTHKMPDWARHLFLSILPRILCMKRPPASSSLSASFYIKELVRSFLKNLKPATIENELDTLDPAQIDLLLPGFSKRSMRKRSRSIAKPLFKSKTELQYHVDKTAAITSVNEIVDNLRREDEKNRVKQEWQYMALVIDRLFLLVFTLVCIIGSLTIILQAPSLYDTATPIDQIKSRRFKR